MKKISITRFIIIAILFASFSSIFAQEEKQKTLIFIDDFNENSSLEPNYYLYFKDISEGKLLGEYKYERLNVNFDLSGPKSIRNVQVHHADVVILILGTANTTINTLDDSINITPNDYRNEYVKFVRKFYEKDQIVVVMSPPPYRTISEDEDKAIIDNINAVQELAEENKKVTYIKLYKHILRNYQDSVISHKELATWIVRLIKDEVEEI